MYLDMVLIHICCKLLAMCQLQVKRVLSSGKLMKVMLAFDGCYFFRKAEVDDCHQNNWVVFAVQVFS